MNHFSVIFSETEVKYLLDLLSNRALNIENYLHNPLVDDSVNICSSFLGEIITIEAVQSSLYTASHIERDSL